MQLGEVVVVYHSQTGEAAIGLAGVVRNHYPDPTEPDGRWVRRAATLARRRGSAAQWPNLYADVTTGRAHIDAPNNGSRNGHRHAERHAGVRRVAVGRWSSPPSLGVA